jgi:hypothetical protein
MGLYGAESDGGVMFVRRSTYDAMEKRALSAELRFYSLQGDWNALIRRINNLGGERFLKHATLQPTPHFSEDELTKLIMLCHPDKHDGKSMATEMTQRLLALKTSMEKSA